MKIATHNGFFHADDVFAIAVLRLAGISDKVVRTRDPEILAASDMRIDVGRAYNSETGDFDHHQDEGAGHRANGLPYASFGMVWKEYGAKLCGSQEAADYIDRRLIQVLDAEDNGHSALESSIEGIVPPLVSRSLMLYNPTWEDKPTMGDYDVAFERAVEVATDLLKQEVRSAQAYAHAAEIVRKALVSTSGPLLELEGELPWREVVVTEAPNILFIVGPRVEGTWSVLAVPKRLGNYKNRKDLPAAWAGKVDAELQKATGVSDAVFCHKSRFLAVAKTRAGALKLAELALNS